MIVLHCDGIRPNQHNSVLKIDHYHKSKGWKGIGYHYWVARDGSVHIGRPVWMVGAHCVGHNKHSIGICYEGGLNAAGDPYDTRTPEQVRSLRKLLEELHGQFPKAVIIGHRDLTHDRDCPCFDAAEEYADLQPK